MNDKFTSSDRDLVIKELERIQKTTLAQVKPSRKLYTDNEGKFYCIFGGKEDWHGIPGDLMGHISKYYDKTLLVIAKKYRTRIDLCVSSAELLATHKTKLPKTKQAGFQFHTVLTEDGLFVEEIPNIHLKKISEIVYSTISEKFDFDSIRKIINLDFLPIYSPSESDEELTHSDIQAKLILIGRLLGYRTFTPDLGKVSKYGKLGDLCSEKRILSEYIADRLLDKVKQIDVIWFDSEGYPINCFEVEHTTDITKGLLRLYQIRKLRIRMFIVAHDTSRNKFDAEVDKDPFFHIKEEYIFRTYNDLQEFFETVKKFASLRDAFLDGDK